MIRINITGKSKNSKLTNPLIREATNYYLKLLKLSNKIKKTLIINIDFTQKLGSKTAATAAPLLYNFSEQTGPEYEICINPNEGFKPGLQALGHELTHVVQWATGQRYDYVREDNMVRWKDKIVNENNVDYWDTPWEIDAWGRQYGLFRRFQAHLKEKEKNERKKKAS